MIDILQMCYHDEAARSVCRQLPPHPNPPPQGLRGRGFTGSCEDARHREHVPPCEGGIEGGSSWAARQTLGRPPNPPFARGGARETPPSEPLPEGEGEKPVPSPSGRG